MYIVVVGSGNGGLTAALCSYEMGTRDVLVIEKSDLYGGTSSISGGGVWIPGNRYARAAGAEDSAAKAKTYLRQLLKSFQLFNLARPRAWPYTLCLVPFAYNISLVRRRP